MNDVVGIFVVRSFFVHQAWYRTLSISSLDSLFHAGLRDKLRLSSQLCRRKLWTSHIKALFSVRKARDTNGLLRINCVPRVLKVSLYSSGKSTLMFSDQWSGKADRLSATRGKGKCQKEMSLATRRNAPWRNPAPCTLTQRNATRNKSSHCTQGNNEANDLRLLTSVH